MTEPAVISATFWHYRPLKSGQMQLIFEVPIERGLEAVLALGGTPKSGESRWCAIALLDPDKLTAGSASQPAGSLPPPGDAEQAPPAAQHKQRWDDMPIAQRAGIMCADPRFWELMGTASEPGASTLMRSTCGVKSRALIASDPKATAAFHELETEYLAAIGRIPKP